MALVTVLSTGLMWGCGEKLTCGPGTTLNADGVCEALLCGVGEIANEDKTACVAIPDPCVNVTCSAGFPNGVASMVAQQINPTSCVCVAAACQDNYMLSNGACVRENPECNIPGFIQEGDLCVPDETTACWQGEGYKSPLCVQELCADHPFAEDGTDLAAIGKCIEDDPPPPESCTNNCHNGISHPHAFGGASTEPCSGCHGGDPTANQRETAHVPIPTEWQTNSTQWGRPNLRYYWNYLTLAGVERFEGGLEWLRFRNPSDLRVADQTCGRESGCHLDRVENVKRSVMATAVGLVGVAQARDGIPRTIVREGNGAYQWDTTEGMTPGSGGMDAIAYDSQYTGSVQRLDKFSLRKRDNIVYNEIDVLREVYDKQCGDCHLGNAGANNRYADFRTSGCASCHMPYALDGRSRSLDQMIPKTEPTYPAAFAQIANFDANDLQNLNGAWLGPERSHPIAHRISLQMSSQRCGSCHVGSNRTDWQFRGYQIDPNRTVAAAFANGFLNADQFKFTDEINDENFGRYHGQAQDQVLRMVDWDNDGYDDIPADFHYTAGLECMDCHTSGEMHNELKFVKVKQVTDWADDAQVKDMSGAIWSHMDQSTEVECVHCHGNLEYRAVPHDADNRNPIKNLIVCPEQGEVIDNYTADPECNRLGRGRWLRSKFTGQYHYVAQTLDTVSNVGTGTGGGAIRPTGAEVYSLQASIFHGRVDQDGANGVGPCIAGDPNNCLQDANNNATRITEGFSHLGSRATSAVDQMQGGLECYACHSTWSNGCFGCHLRLADTDGNVILRDFMRSTGELSYGVVTEADFTYISPLDTQYGINSEGKIAQMLPETKQQVAHLDKDNNEFFGTKVIVNNDANIAYNLYRDRAGYGLRQYATETTGLGYPSAGLPAEQFAEMDLGENPQGENQFMPHTVQRTHPTLMNCENCHINANADNTDLILARYGANAAGFANVSAYLAVLGNVGVITRNNSNQDAVVDAAAGFRFDANLDPTAFNVNQQMDYFVIEGTGFPLAYNNHPAKYTPGAAGNPAWNGTYVRQYPTFAQMAGPLNQYLLNKMLNLVKRDNENLDQ